MLCCLKPGVIARFDANIIAIEGSAETRKMPQKATSSAIAKKLVNFSFWYIFFLESAAFFIDAPLAQPFPMARGKTDSIRLFGATRQSSG
jgi:hypothetical protein